MRACSPGGWDSSLCSEKSKQIIYKSQQIQFVMICYRFVSIFARQGTHFPDRSSTRKGKQPTQRIQAASAALNQNNLNNSNNQPPKIRFLHAWWVGLLAVLREIQTNYIQIPTNPICNDL